ncbi:MAG: hypothetical protein V4757_07540 [Pseudomonadota bacterium]
MHTPSHAFVRALAACLLALAATGAQAAILASPASLAYSTVAGVPAPPQSLTISNTGAGPVNFTSATVTPGGVFVPHTGTSNCFSGPLPAGGSCVISITTNPQPAGSYSGAFRMTTAEFGSLVVAPAALTMNVAPAGSSGPGPAAGSGSTGALTDVSPRQFGLNTTLRTSRQLAYTFAPGTTSVRPRGAWVCTDLTGPQPPSGTSATNPCAAGAQSRPLAPDAAGLQLQRGANGQILRALETVSIPQAYASLALSRPGPPVLYFVREFDGSGYAVVQMTVVGNSLAAPLTLTDVRMAFLVGPARRPTAAVEPGQRPPPSVAEIRYSGSGVLRGRWEVVEPGREPPEPGDLVTEASVPFANRGLQRRYTVVERFEQVLGVAGRYDLKGPDPARLPVRQTGTYLLLLRIEAVPARQPGLAAGAEHGAAGFALPVLAYSVGTGIDSSSVLASRIITLLPAGTSGPPAIAWQPVEQAHIYRVEFADAAGQLVGSRFQRADEPLRYQLGGALAMRVRNAARWRVRAFDAGFRPVGRSDWVELDARAVARPAVR